MQLYFHYFSPILLCKLLTFIGVYVEDLYFVLLQKRQYVNATNLNPAHYCII